MTTKDPWPQACVARSSPDEMLYADEDAIRNSSGDIIYPIERGIVIVLRETTGNNKAAVEFYDGSKWRRFRFWEELFYRFQGGRKSVLNQFMQYLPSESECRFLNVAIGEGNTNELTPDGWEVYGVDISYPQLAVCRDRFSGRQLRLFQAEAEHLPFKDGVFDHSMTAGAINFFSDPRAAIRELVRVTKPGGCVLIADEVPTMAKRLKRTRFGRRILKRTFGQSFSEVIQARTELDIHRLAEGLLDDWRLHLIWRKRGYCITGRVPAPDTEQSAVQS